MAVSKITIEADGDTADLQADALARALLVQVREMAARRPGVYTVSARLNDDSSYSWKWDWFPASEKHGERAGGSVVAVAVAT